MEIKLKSGKIQSLIWWLIFYFPKFMSLKLNVSWALFIKDDLKQRCHSKWLIGKKIPICPLPKPLTAGNSEIRKTVWGIIWYSSQVIHTLGSPFRKFTHHYNHWMHLDGSIKLFPTHLSCIHYNDKLQVIRTSKKGIKISHFEIPCTLRF